jgi:hypothetical protein
MASRMIAPQEYARHRVAEPTVGFRAIASALAISLAFVAMTRWPVARAAPLESDEFGYLAAIRAHWLPIHHTLFLASARALGAVVGDAYRGFIVLDMVVSALALTSVWWWLRALVRPATAAAATLALAVAPVFWSYGAMAGTYPAIVLVGSFLLGVAVRTWDAPRPWHPIAASAVLAWGTAYRQDIGTLWLPVFLVILWAHRWRRALGAAALFAALNLAWFVPMLLDVGGWARYRQASAEFAHSAGYLNSAWSLGLIDAPLRYAVKLTMALLWTLGPGLLAAPRGLARLWREPGGRPIAALLALSVAPALGSHLLVHFGVAGYAFHDVPALMALLALGIGRTPDLGGDRSGPRRLVALSAVLAAAFWFYPTDFARPGLRGSFDLAFARHTRIGLRSRADGRTPAYWRTANSRPTPAGSVPPAETARPLPTPLLKGN